MKTLKITLRQSDAGQFRVERFTNTVQLSVGQLVPVATVENWCAMARVQVEVIGMVQDEEDSESPPVLNDARRPDALQLASACMEDNL
jgi:hypothetical protein